MDNKSKGLSESDLVCPDCEECSVVDDNPEDYDLEHNRYKCPECNTRFYDVDGSLISEESYDEMHDTSWMHPNETEEEFWEHEDF